MYRKCWKKTVKQFSKITLRFMEEAYGKNVLKISDEAQGVLVHFEKLTDRNFNLFKVNVFGQVIDYISLICIHF